MLKLSTHAIYRYAKRIFYQDVCDKRRDLSPKMFSMVRQHASTTIENMVAICDGKYPIDNSPLVAVVKNKIIVTFIYKLGQIEEDYV